MAAPKLINCVALSRKIDAMALEAVSSAINGTLVPLLSSEVQLLGNIHTEVASIKAELESIMSFLKDADTSAKLKNERAKTWVEQVRAVAYQIEDVMDEYALHLAENKQRHGFIGFLHKMARSITQLKPRHEIASQIQVGDLPKQHLLGTLAMNFKLLKVLDLLDAPLDEIHEDEGGLPVLKELQIGNCRQLKEVTSGIRNLRKLRSLYFEDMPTEFLDRMKPDKGQDYSIVEHVPNVKFILVMGGFKRYTLHEYQEARESRRLKSLNDGPERLKSLNDGPATVEGVTASTCSGGNSCFGR
ncbi:hypothetical protein RHSIM_Rhsim02G0079800 [Rhododendron simsii]|uniref:Disease resistance N-terminal domain-containing protein n=1 Tax=Rhododendron simsii TaxID=118357 RepID=A0A834HGF8_RHOSS|nr:hypothetical protein RHSIM_Rhsim02G0079800 [Rhododendron simsii]